MNWSERVAHNSKDRTLTCAAPCRRDRSLSSSAGRPTARRTCPPARVPARVSRVDRGRLSVLTADGESRVHPAAALYDEAGLAGPAVGDWVALRGELAVAVLHPDERLRAHGRRPDVGGAGGRRQPGRRPRGRRAGRRGPAAPGGALPRGRVEQRRDAGRRPHQGRPVRRRRGGRRAGAPRTPWASRCCRSARSPGRGWTPSARCWAAGRTGAMVGPSGVGKSSLANALAGRPLAATGEIRGRRPRPAHDDRA